MKKILSVVFASVALISGAFAKGIYSGDIQAQVGVGINSAEWKTELLGISATEKINATNFDCAISSWNLFALNDVVGIGFNLNFMYQQGKSTYKPEFLPISDITLENRKFSFDIGPAAGFTLGSVVRFNVAAGLAMTFVDQYTTSPGSLKGDSFSSDSNALFSQSKLVMGFYADLQAKFIPNFFLSPIVGYRFTSSSATNAFNSLGGTVADIKFTNVSNEIYAGLSINW